MATWLAAHDGLLAYLVPQIHGEAGIAEPRFLADAVSPTEGWEDVIDRYLNDLADSVLLDAGDLIEQTANALPYV